MKVWCAIALLTLQAAPGSSVGQEAVVRALTNGDFASRAPAWSPDGARIAFETDQGGQWKIHVMDVATGAVERVTSSDAHERYPAWSPDGGRIVFVCGHGEETELCVREFAGGAVTRVMAPDGRSIVYTAVRREGEQYQLYLEQLPPAAR